ncbi:universal stress protein [Streptomyces acidiscabies]|uniref:Universal stress protein n=1 Tax=Streptomyces acidiscabies TaxID=42234 RepID=A0A0L0JSL1_9ACTN|nr:universal stress protein [Streptomyces acidiscabies]KND28484.1 universal stress protein [Streptomyces acidiscabies]GAV37201.1 universal stress protein/MT2061 [Streptomyces acidiscabies]
MQPIVVGVDDSEPSLRAMDWAADEAALRGAPLRLVHASTWRRYEEDGAGGWSHDLRLLESAARRAQRRAPEVTITTEVAAEDPEPALLRAARDAGALVLGSRSRPGLTELLRGSVSLTVAARAECPVIVVRGHHDNQARPGVHGRVVVGVGGPAAVRFAVREAEVRDAELEAVRTWRSPARPAPSGEAVRPPEQRASAALERALRHAPERLRIRRRTAEGHARRLLVSASFAADLLVVGTRSRAGRLGLVTHRVLHDAACPVAVVPERRR